MNRQTEKRKFLFHDGNVEYSFYYKKNDPFQTLDGLYSMFFKDNSIDYKKTYKDGILNGIHMDFKYENKSHNPNI